jgi:hypothetical protein
VAHAARGQVVADESPDNEGERLVTADQTELQAGLAAILPGSWQAALAAAEELAWRLQYLAWPDRAKLLDEYLWMEARARLSTDGVTAVVNRHPETFRRAHPAVAYATWCTAIVASVLQLLGEDGRAGCAEHALTLLLSRRPEHRDAADAWLVGATPEELQRELARLPGYAFLLLTLCPNDSAESFIARDAFWTAMLG